MRAIHWSNPLVNAFTWCRTRRRFKQTEWNTHKHKSQLECTIWGIYFNHSLATTAQKPKNNRHRFHAIVWHFHSILTWTVTTNDSNFCSFLLVVSPWDSIQSSKYSLLSFKMSKKFIQKCVWTQIFHVFFSSSSDYYYYLP